MKEKKEEKSRGKLILGYMIIDVVKLFVFSHAFFYQIQNITFFYQS